MTNFTPCKGSVEMGGGEVHEIKGRGDLGIDFFSGVESLRMLIQNVAYVPTLKSHLISVSKAIEQGHKFGIDIPGLIMESKSTGDKIPLPPAGGYAPLLRPPSCGLRTSPHSNHPRAFAHH